MLVEFSVSNFLSFKEKVTLSMVAGSVKEHEENNTFKKKTLRLLKSASIYGANASGKSNLIKALRFVKEFIVDSSTNMNITEKIPVQNFKLSTATENEPSFFEIVFFIDETLYRYNFEATPERILSENLYFTPGKKEATLFKRCDEKIELKKYFKNEGKGLEAKTRPNALFLSVVAQFNGEISKKIIEWFNNCEIHSGLSDRSIGHTFQFLETQENRKKIIQFIKSIDVSIHEINLNELSIPIEEVRNQLPKEVVEKLTTKDDSVHMVSILSRHKKYDNNRKFLEYIDFDFAKTESDGTKKILALAGLIIECQLNSKLLIIDELDARLHPHLSTYLIKLFNSCISNPNCSQIIFTTHDVKLMNSNLFRRDQIWFTAKTECETTDLYSLLEYKKGIRNDEVFEKNYMQGRYGAIPYINEIENSFNC